MMKKEPDWNLAARICREEMPESYKWERVPGEYVRIYLPDRIVKLPMSVGIAVCKHEEGAADNLRRRLREIMAIESEKTDEGVVLLLPNGERTKPLTKEEATSGLWQYSAPDETIRLDIIRRKENRNGV